MNGRQVAEDQVDEPGLRGAVLVYKRAHSFGVLGPAVTRDECPRHIFRCRICRI